MRSPPRGQILLFAVAFEGGLVGLWLLLGRLLGRPPSTQGASEGAAFLTGCLATLPLLPLLFGVARSSLPPFRRLMNHIDGVLVPYLANLAVSDFALIALLAGIGEEGIFRGILQGALSEITSPVTALTVASVVFGLLHFITPTYAVLAGILGFYLGWLYLVSGNLVVPIVVHALYDFIALLYLMRWRRR